MKNPTCPQCSKTVQHRHTYMTTFPLTLVCAGCGSWLQLDVKRTGSIFVLALSFITLGLAYFSPYLLVLLPLYLVLSMGPLLSFSVEMIKKRKVDLWTINRRTGLLRPLKDAEKDAQYDMQLSNKLIGVRPFRALASGLPSRKVKSSETGAEEQPYSKSQRPKYDLDDLPTGLPH